MNFPEPCYLKMLDGVSGDGYLLSTSDTYNRSPAHLASTDDGTGRQRWKLVPDESGPSDTYHIIAQDGSNTPHLCWSDNVVHFMSLSSIINQRWRIIPTGDGVSYLIKAAQSRNPLPGEVSTNFPFLSCSSDGTRVDMWSEDDGSGRQRWYITADSARVPPTPPRLTAADIPAATKGFFFTLPTSDFQARLQQGGTLKLSGEDLDLGGPDPDNGDPILLALDALELNQARIITGGKKVAIFVNRLTSQSGSIIAYTDLQRKAARGADGVGSGQSGQAGEAGGGGGSVSIYVIESFDGSLKVDLRGQDGGDGGNGTSGANGSPGAPGPVVSTFSRSDLAAAGNGGDGGAGQNGGNGGNGGKGGDGGVLKLLNVGASPIPDTSLIFSATGGQGGLGGHPGAGGAGGPGGPLGASDVIENFSPGAQGPNGAAGTPGLVGTPGSDGQVTKNNVDFATIAQLAYPYITSPQS